MPTETESGITTPTTTPGSAHSRPTHEHRQDSRPSEQSSDDANLLISSTPTKQILSQTFIRNYSPASSLLLERETSLNKH